MISFLLRLAIALPTQNVREHGAKGDGKAIDTNAIAAAFDACNRSGGGTVLFPEGTYLTLPFNLSCSNAVVMITPRATVLAVDISRMLSGPSGLTRLNRALLG